MKERHAQLRKAFEWNHRFVCLAVVWAVAGITIADVPADPDAAAVQKDIQYLLDSMRTTEGVQAAPQDAEPARIRLKDGYIHSLQAGPNHYFPVSGIVADDPTATAKNFIRERGPAFGVKSKVVDFTSKKSVKSNGRSYERFSQTYSQIPVFGAEILIQLNAAHGVEYVMSDVMRQTTALDEGKIPTVPTITADDAAFLAVERMKEKHPDLKLEADDGQLMVYQPQVVGNSGSTRLVWKTAVVSPTSPQVNELVLVDAHTGEIALQYTLIMEARSRRIYDAVNTAADPGTLARSEGGAATGITDVDKGYDFFGHIYDFYYNEHGRDSIDNAGMIMSATVRICPYYPSNCPYANAFWNGSRMYFGQGFVTDDVAAHELTHGVTQYESDLVYQNESGAINESFSDMWGEWIDLTNGAGNDSPSVRWLCGEDLAAGAIRSLSNPPAYGDPDRKTSPYWYTGTGDNGGVHINSGVGNKLCYLLTDGAAFNGYTVTGMGISAIADLMYEVQTHLLASGADYADLHTALTQAAINLGWSTANRANLENACLATELSYTYPAPENDLCADAIPVLNGVQVSGTTVNATGSDITTCTSGDAADVWYLHTATASGSKRVSLCGSSYDTSLAVFSACGGTQLACNDDACDLSSQVTLSMTAGSTYFIRVSGYGGETGQFVLIVTANDPVPPAAQNGNANTKVNTPVTITLAATDDGQPSPPGVLNYIVAGLPAHGQLTDPGSGPITSVPYTLANYGRQVVYTPVGGYIGSDSFTFRANDGGTPPAGGDSNLATISVNVLGVIYLADMETNPGWTATGQWQWGVPTGGGSHCYDPTSGHTGTKVYGYNLSGDYSNSMSAQRLTTGAIDCRGYTNVTLKFWRRLGIESSSYDHAMVEVSRNGTTWTTVYNHTSGSFCESTWTQLAYSISAVADDQQTVYIRWTMGPTDSSITYPGWNIDDVELTGDFAGPTPPTAQNVTAGTFADMPVQITLAATDDLLPNPPAALTYIVTSLPAHGELSDPSGGIISSVPYALAGFGNRIVYAPAVSYTGSDIFQFKANDGGTAPDGGDSNTAAVSISVSSCTASPSDPMPANGADHVPLDILLNWNRQSQTNIIEDFEDGSMAEYIIAGGSYTPAAAAAHDGLLGLDASGEWAYRTDALVAQGDTISYWVYLRSPGRAYCGFGASGQGAYSFVVGANTGELELQKNVGFGFLEMASAAHAWAYNQWYLMKVQWDIGGTITGRLYDSDGVTLLKTISAADTTYTSGGIAFRAFGDVGSHYFDTIKREGPAFALRPLPPANLAQNGMLQRDPADAVGWDEENAAYIWPRTEPQSSTTGAKADNESAANEPDAAAPSQTVVHAVDGDVSVLVFDSYRTNGTFAQDALTNLGIGFTDVGADQAAFDAQMDSHAWDLVIYDMSSTSINTSSKDRLKSYITSGGRVLIFWWDMDSDTAFAAAFEAAVVSDFFAPKIVYGASPLHSVWSAPNAINLPLDDIRDVMNDDGDVLRATAGGIVLGSFTPGGGSTTNEAMILGNSGRTVIHGFSPDEVGYLDSDSSGKADRVELYENEISLLLGGAGGDIYDVYLDTANPPATLIHSGLTDSSCQPVPFPLGCQTTYYWRVVAHSPAGCQKAGPVWSFTTAMAGDIDANCSVNFGDFTMLASHWVRADCITPGWCVGADLDASGDVVFEDLLMLAEHWLQSAD